MSIVTGIFFVAEQDTVKIDLTCDFNPEDILDRLTKVVDDIYDVRYKIMFNLH